MGIRRGTRSGNLVTTSDLGRAAPTKQLRQKPDTKSRGSGQAEGGSGRRLSLQKFVEKERRGKCGS